MGSSVEATMPMKGSFTEMTAAKDSGDSQDTSLDSNSKSEHHSLNVLNVKISGGAVWQFFVCVAGVFACGVTHDFVQEYIFRLDDFDFGWFMTLWSFPPVFRLGALYTN